MVPRAASSPSHQQFQLLEHVQTILLRRYTLSVYEREYSWAGRSILLRMSCGAVLWLVRLIDFTNGLRSRRNTCGAYDSHHQLEVILCLVIGSPCETLFPAFCCLRELFVSMNRYACR
jgi:hypothetical protein